MTRPHSAIDGDQRATAWRIVGAGRLRITVFWLVLSLAASCGGCGRSPQFAAKDQRLLEALRTAISAHKTEWLEASAKQIDKAHQQRTISDEGFEALQSPITEARSGDWKQAEKEIIQLEKSQRPPAK